MIVVQSLQSWTSAPGKLVCRGDIHASLQQRDLDREGVGRNVQTCERFLLPKSYGSCPNTR